MELQLATMHYYLLLLLFHSTFNWGSGHCPDSQAVRGIANDCHVSLPSSRVRCAVGMLCPIWLGKTIWKPDL